ncbi:rhomboid family intramembrane serine protease, partial [Candidatus Bathyarchaeota archaeon]|nr:rhomboid family intramembrane serine protease [Candidatus Bathyarchaeota archaeon]
MFLTSIFLHADTSHLFFNMLALLFFGTSLERMIGGRRFALLFIFSGVVGNIGHLLTAGDPYTPAIGSSGAIYGLIGALATLRPFMIVYVYGMAPLPMVVAAALWVLLDLAGLFVPSGVAHGAHLAGMLVGIALGLYYRVLWASLRTWRYIY